MSLSEEIVRGFRASTDDLESPEVRASAPPNWMTNGEHFDNMGSVFDAMESRWRVAVKKVFAAAKKRQRNLGEHEIAFAFADLPTPNAIAFRSPVDSSYGIVVDHRLFGHTSNVLMSALAIEHSPRLHRQKNLATIANFFAMSVGGRKFNKKASRDCFFAFRKLTERFHDFSGMSEDFMRMFVYAHEVGHIYLGHLSKNGVTEMRVGPKGRKAEVAGLQHEHEFEADDFAQKLMIEEFEDFFGHKDLEANYVLVTNVRLFFEAQWFISKFLPTPDDRLGTQGYASTHPDPTDRAERILQNYNKFAIAPKSWDMDTVRLIEQIRNLAEEKRIRASISKSG